MAKTVFQVLTAKHGSSLQQHLSTFDTVDEAMTMGSDWTSPTAEQLENDASLVKVAHNCGHQFFIRSIVKADVELFFVTRNDFDDGPTYVYKCDSKQVADNVAKFLAANHTYAGRHGAENAVVDVFSEDDFINEYEYSLTANAERWRVNAKKVITASTELGEKGWDTGAKRKLNI